MNAETHKLRMGAVISIILFGLMSTWTMQSANADPCDLRVQKCETKTSASNNGAETVLRGELTKVPLDTGQPGSSGPRAGSPGSSAVAPVPPPPAVVRDGYTVTIPVTLADLAKFRPTSAIDFMEPNGWMIVGLSANFYAHASTHVKAGELLGGPASVRFTPVQYTWTYGDGAVRNSTTPGATWMELGFNEFDETRTSHIYRAPGRYAIDLTVGYAPEYRLGTSPGWIPVNGLVWGPANRLIAVASANAKTVLVENECTTNPNGPGC